jgi:putative tryptophan/tyrosine transport system substrate-binding protein
MLDRRRFLAALTGSLVMTRSVANAQPTGKVYRVGFLLGATGESVTSLFDALKDGLRELGYVEGRNVVFEQRYGAGHMERLPDLAAELVRLHADVIVTGTNIHVQAVRAATATIPIVMVFAADPVGSKFVTSLARPGGNTTGLSAEASPELWGKYLTLLKEVVPKLSRVGVLGQVSSHVGFIELAAASRQLNIALEVADLKTPEDFNDVFAGMVRKRIDAVLIIIGPLTYLLQRQIAEAALKNHLPSITNAKQYAQAGLLMSYGPNLDDLYRRAAIYVDKILRGAKPADLPVEQPSKYELVINLKTAKALGTTIPQSLLVRADDRIE